jgi:hypothetical protein
MCLIVGRNKKNTEFCTVISKVRESNAQSAGLSSFRTHPAGHYSVGERRLGDIT